jgi:tetratricopeptide (TPR) repeat protein
MKRTLLSACVVALTFTACKNNAPNSAKTPRPIARVSPAPVSSRVLPSPLAPAPVAVALPDAGGEVGAPPPDSLALAHDPDHVDHLTRAQQLRSEGDLPGALTEARRAVADDGNDEDALMLVGRLGRMTGDEGMAAEAYGRIASLEPQDASPLIQQARVLVHLKQYGQAEEVANAALSRDADDPEVYQVLGRAYLSEGQLQKAIDSFQKVIALEPTHGYALNNLGLAYLRTNQNSEAAEVLEQAAMLLPDIAYVQNNLGIALERTGDKDDAQAAYARAMSLSPKYLKAQLNNGRLERLASAQAPGDALPDLQEVPEDGSADAQ